MVRRPLVALDAFRSGQFEPLVTRNINTPNIFVLCFKNHLWNFAKALMSGCLEFCPVLVSYKLLKQTKQTTETQYKTKPETAMYIHTYIKPSWPASSKDGWPHSAIYCTVKSAYLSCSSPAGTDGSASSSTTTSFALH
jgi:hypothetical protein